MSLIDLIILILVVSWLFGGGLSFALSAIQLLIVIAVILFLYRFIKREGR